MIFVTVGSQKFAFNRLLMEIDRLIEKGVITENVFAQKGCCDYKPLYFESKEFLDRTEFKNIIDQSSIVITHGGTGAIINAVKNNKKVIAIARDCKFGEHVDNHQRQIIEQFSRAGIILGAHDVNELERMLIQINEFKPIAYMSSTKAILESLGEYIESI